MARVMTGTVGRVSWTTQDDGCSYNPSLSFAAAEIVIARGTMWGASTDGHGTMTVVRYDQEDEYECDEFVWSMEAFVDAVAAAVEGVVTTRGLLADDDEGLDIVAAAHELWFAIIQVGACEVAS